MHKVFGIGWAKTGTTTLGHALEILGYSHKSQDLDLLFALRDGDWDSICSVVERYDCFEDWPWILIYKEMDKKFPDSKFILTMRDSSRWIRSYENMRKHGRDPRKNINQAREVIYGFSDFRGMNRQLLEIYNRHNIEVKDYFRNRPEDLLVIDWEKRGGWNELCEFLNLPVPRLEFPHENKGGYSIASRIRRRIKSFLN